MCISPYSAIRVVPSKCRSDGAGTLPQGIDSQNMAFLCQGVRSSVLFYIFAQLMLKLRQAHNIMDQPPRRLGTVVVVPLVLCNLSFLKVSVAST